MKKYSIFFIVSIFIVTIITLMFFRTNSNTVYGRIFVVEDKETAIKSLNISIPKQIVIHTNFYRNTIITSKLEIDEILDLINTIKTSSSKDNVILESKNSSYTIMGKIIYNNKVDEFSLNNKLVFDNHIYNSNSYLINSLHKKLINYFNTYEHLIDILNTNESNVLYEGNNKSFYLNKNEQKKLARSLSKLKLMNDETKLNKVKIEDKKLYTLKIKINKNINNKTNNLIFIDVYKGYVAIQFLADDNGKKIYMEGNIYEN